MSDDENDGKYLLYFKLISTTPSADNDETNADDDDDGNDDDDDDCRSLQKEAPNVMLSRPEVFARIDEGLIQSSTAHHDRHLQQAQPTSRHDDHYEHVTTATTTDYD